MGAHQSGIILIDKPAGITSAGVVARVKQHLSARKVGHAGTLDPFATGLIICCVNRATRLARFLLHDFKRYAATLHLGVETDTQDATGAVIATHSIAKVNAEKIETVIRQFLGTISQRPPVYSALKHNGVPLYKLARQGKPIQKPARQVKIERIKVTAIDMPKIFFEVACSAGTYIRSLGADMGNALGCGGHLSALHRTRSGGFSIENALSLSEFETLAKTNRLGNHLIGLADSLQGMPAVTADEAVALKLKHGRPILLKDVGLNGREIGHDTNKWLKVVAPNKHLLAVLDFDPKGRSFDYCCSFVN